MKYLLDVNVLVAWGWQDHLDHLKVCTWIVKLEKSPRDSFLTSAIPQLGFVRVSVQRTGGQVTPEIASHVLDSMLKSLGRKHQFLADDQPSERWPAWCQGAGRTTDAHLLALAQAHGAALATLDQGIPGAHFIS